MPAAPDSLAPLTPLAPLAPEAAWSRIEACCAALESVRLDRRQARGRRLAESLVASTEVPPCDVSALDGFAYSGELAAGGALDVALTVVAGDPPGATLPAGTAARIWTGAPVPAGADRVVGIEYVTEEPGRVTVLEPVAAGAAIRRRAEILELGAPLLGPGARLGPAALALLASQGIAEVSVVRAPRIAVLATGDEVVPPEQTPAPGQLRDSHTDYLVAALHALGLEHRSLGIAGDDAGELHDRIAAALEWADVTLVCGGVSMGGRDYTEAALTALGATIVFNGVAVQPGKPLVFAHRDRRLLFGLPGNPASVMVAFRLFVEPALDRLAGGDDFFWRDARALRLETALPGGKARDRFVPARAGRSASGDASGASVRPLGVRGSHDLSTFAVADRLLRIRAGDPPRAAGERIEAVEWR